MRIINMQFLTKYTVPISLHKEGQAGAGLGVPVYRLIWILRKFEFSYIEITWREQIFEWQYNTLINIWVAFESDL